MARRKEKDDGRTIADMSQVGRPSLLGHLPAGGHADGTKRENTQSGVPEQSPFTKEERRWIVLGTLKAALLIGFAFIGGLGLVILLLMLIWHIL